MGYNGTLQIEEEILRLLRNNHKMTASDMATTLQTTENNVMQGICHLRKNVLKPDEAIITHMKKKKSSGKSCQYELIVQGTSRVDAIHQESVVIKKVTRSLREITKLNMVLLNTTNPAQAMQIKMQIAALMTQVSREFNLANMGVLPATNKI